MTDGREQDVAAGLVRLRLDGELDVVALLLDVGRQEVEAVAEAVERIADVLGEVVLGTLAAAPEHVRLGAELGGEVDVLGDLGEREAAHATVVGGEAAVLEDRVAERVGGDHRHLEAVGLDGVAEVLDRRGALGVVGVEVEDVVVVERDAVGAELGDLADRVSRVHRGTGRATEDVDALPRDGPQTEGELVSGGGLVVAHRTHPFQGSISFKL